MDYNTFIKRLSELGKQAISIAKTCTIFRASSAYNCQHITSLSEYLANNENINLDTSYSIEFNDILSIVEDFIVFLNKLTKEDSFNLIMTRTNEMLTFLEFFPKRLETAAAKLGIKTEEAIPNTSKQKRINRRSDLYKMRVQLQHWVIDKDNDKSPMLDEVKAKIDSLMEIEGCKDEVDRKLLDLKRLDINDDIELDSKAADKHLGAGGFGTVCKATRKSTAEFVAVKEIRGDKISPSSWSSLFAEIVNMYKIHHPYVLELVGAHIREPYRIITRYCSGRSLFDRLHRQSQLPTLNSTDLTKIAYQVASGMKYLHENKIVHRDLKTLNILLDGNGNACIADFGLSGNMNESESETFGERVGTPHYTAPEVLAHTRYGQKVDVYSYAIVLWEMLTKRVPFSDKPPTSIYDHVVTCGWRLPFPIEARESDPELCKLITQCWAKDPNDRPEFSEIVERFEKGNIKFPKSESIDYEELKKEVHCPPLNVGYALSVMKNVENPYFGSVTRFVAERIDQKLAEVLVQENILSYMLKSTSNFDSILLLASKLITKTDDFCEFLDNGGINMLKETISKGVLNGALKFGIVLPKELNMYFEQFVPQIISRLEDNSVGTESEREELMMNIFKFIRKFPDKRICEFSNVICEYLPKAAKIIASDSSLSTVENYNAVVDLFIVCRHGVSDISIFYQLVSDKFVVKTAFVEELKNISKEEDYALFVLQMLKAMRKTDLTYFLTEFLKSKEEKKSEIFVKLYEMPECFDTLRLLISDQSLKDRILAPLLVFYEIAQIKEAAIQLANSELLSALFDMTSYNEQRLQILTALTQYEEFCITTEEMDNIIHRLASDLMTEEYRDCSIHLILAMSMHEKGCEILSNDGVFLPFAQLFLSSSIKDSSAAYIILHNAAKYKAHIQQVPLIVSCLMQTMTFKMVRKSEILDTLIALVKNMQGSVQDSDLRTIIIPQMKEESPPVVYRCLILFSVCDPNKLSKQTVEELLSAINIILNSDNMMYPCIIDVITKVIDNLSPKKLQSFFRTTDFLNFLKSVAGMFTEKDDASYINSYIEKMQSSAKVEFPISGTKNFEPAEHRGPSKSRSNILHFPVRKI